MNKAKTSNQDTMLLENNIQFYLNLFHTYTISTCYIHKISCLSKFSYDIYSHADSVPKK